jgi:hypothetical protein
MIRTRSGSDGMGAQAARLRSHPVAAAPGSNTQKDCNNPTAKTSLLETNLSRAFWLTLADQPPDCLLQVAILSRLYSQPLN